MRSSRPRQVVYASVAIALVATAVAAWQWFERWSASPLAISGESVVVEIPRGQPLLVTANELSRKGILDHPRLFAIYARWTGADARVRAGEYAVPRGTSPTELLSLLESGRVIHHSLTIVEGWTFRDVRRALAKEPLIVHMLGGQDDAAVMRALGEPSMSPEGLFFPDTYLFDKGTPDIAILRQARARMRAELDKAWAARSEGLPLGNPYDALILASIVEKETARPSERPRIAGVFVERLRAGMRLQTDPTVIYGLGDRFDGNLRRADLERDGPYNTYTRAGLPPTPIAMPGAASLAAVVRPDERGELYFVATGLPDGSHAFSRTLSEHERAVADYLKRYRQQNTGH